MFWLREDASMRGTMPLGAPLHHCARDALASASGDNLVATAKLLPHETLGQFLGGYGLMECAVPFFW